MIILEAFSVRLVQLVKSRSLISLIVAQVSQFRKWWSVCVNTIWSCASWSSLWARQFEMTWWLEFVCGLLVCVAWPWSCVYLKWNRVSAKAVSCGTNSLVASLHLRKFQRDAVCSSAAWWGYYSDVQLTSGTRAGPDRGLRRRMSSPPTKPDTGIKGSGGNPGSY
jgi:hypothetical protein